MTTAADKPAESAMKNGTRHLAVDLAVIGSGLAGFASSIFALDRKIVTAQVGNTGAVAYTTGYLDLLGQEEDSRAIVTDPWQALARLAASRPDHPLARVPRAEIHEAFARFTAFLGEGGIAYSAPGERNQTALTPAGTVKQTFCVPATMAAGCRAYTEKTVCVIVDFKGLKGFSGRQVVANLREKWPGLTTARIDFPDLVTGEIYPEVMARALEVPAVREKLAVRLKSAAGAAKIVGLPAVLGMHRPDRVKAELERLTGLTLFEIPTMPPSVPGIRLREMFEQVLPQKGVTLIPQQKVTRLAFQADGAVLALADSYGPIELRARAVILATGRFLSGGLTAARTGITETLLGLPVVQPDGRDHWYRERYTDPRGHAIHRAGLSVDDAFRPLGPDGRPHHERLFTAGVILAHQDWIRGRSGAGIAIASAYRAVAAAESYLSSSKIK